MFCAEKLRRKENAGKGEPSETLAPCRHHARHRSPASLPSQGNPPGEEGNQTRVHKPKERRPGKEKLRTQREAKACTDHDHRPPAARAPPPSALTLRSLCWTGPETQMHTFRPLSDTAQQLHGTDTEFNQLPSQCILNLLQGARTFFPQCDLLTSLPVCT